MNPAHVAPGTLPRDGFTRLFRAVQLSGMGRTTVWRLMSEGRFPQAIKLSPGASVIRNADFLDWLADPVNWRAPKADAPAHSSEASSKPSKSRKHVVATA